MPFGISMGLFFAPITVLVMNNSNGKIEQCIMTMDYVRFIGGSFGTAIATNNLVYYKDKEFDGMVSLQNYEVVREFLENLEKQFFLVAKVIFRMYEEFMAFNYGFKYVWLDAAFWGFLGSIFIFMLLFVKEKQ
jgi:DHA2 family multidrug resistance protein